MCGALTLAVVEVAVGGSVVLAQPLQDELVVHEALDGLEQEGVEGQVAHLLQLKLLVDRLQLLQSLGGFLQLRQHLVVLLQEAGELLGTDTETMKPSSPVITSEKESLRIDRHLQRTHVPQHHVADPLVVAFDVSVRAPLPGQNTQIVSLWVSAPSKQFTIKVSFSTRVNLVLVMSWRRGSPHYSSISSQMLLVATLNSCTQTQQASVKVIVTIVGEVVIKYRYDDLPRQIYPICRIYFTCPSGQECIENTRKGEGL